MAFSVSDAVLSEDVAVAVVRSRSDTDDFDVVAMIAFTDVFPAESLG